MLDGESAYIERNGQKITVTGTYFCPVDFSVYSEKNDSDGFNIWLHHFPEGLQGWQYHLWRTLGGIEELYRGYPEPRNEKAADKYPAY